MFISIHAIHGGHEISGTRWQVGAFLSGSQLWGLFWTTLLHFRIWLESSVNFGHNQKRLQSGNQNGLNFSSGSPFFST